MNLATAIKLYGYGTSEGVTKAWDTRGRGKLRAEETTEDRYRNKETGLWNQDRLDRVHEPAISEKVDGKNPPVGRKPIAYVMGGGTATGKTTLRDLLLEPNPDRVVIDNDENKFKIPEFEGLKKEDPDHAAYRVHEESGFLTKSMLAEAISRRLDLTYDTTSSSSKSSAAAIKTMLNNGYEVHSIFADLPLAQAKERANWRADHSDNPADAGRRIPDHIIEEAHQGAVRNFFTLKDIPGISSINLYDTSGKPGEQKLVYSKAGGEETIHDPKGYARFKRKTYEDIHASVQRHRHGTEDRRRRARQNGRTKET